MAITIDDLPRGGDGGARTLPAIRAMTTKLMAPFREGRIPVIGFVNEGRAADLGPDGLREILDIWLEAGADLGNHTYSHPNINNVPLDDYTATSSRASPSPRGARGAWQDAALLPAPLPLHWSDARD